MKNKAREILEEYANCYSEVNVKSLANILDEIRRETAREIFDYLVESTVIRTAPDTIRMFFKEKYCVEVGDEK